MECPLWKLPISSRSVNKHDHHRQFLFLIGRFLKNLLWRNCLSQMNWNLVGSIYMYGRFCIKFPESRMKGERHWASSLIFLLLIKSLYNWKKLVILMIPKTELFLKYSWICVCQFCQIFGHTNNRQN